MTERRIVVGVEGSGYARAALVWALGEATHRPAVVEVVTCYSPTYVPAAPDLGYVPLDLLDLVSEVEKLQGEVIDSAMEAAGHPDVEIRRTMTKGRAPATLMADTMDRSNDPVSGIFSAIADSNGSSS